MAHSSSLIADITTVLTNGPSTTTIANAISATGPIMDYVGNTELIQTKFKGWVGILTYMITDTDASTDSTNRNLLLGVKAVLLGTGSPSTSVLADLKSVLSNGPAAATTANAIAAAGPIMDYVGLNNDLIVAVEEAELLLTAMISVTDTGTDGTNKTLLTNINNTLKGVA